jgi:2'-5' RNA ligase
MHGILSLLDQEHETLVYRLWQELEQYCRLSGVKVTPFPHFSWLIAADFDWPALDNVMQETAEKIHPFMVRTTGLSLFTGENPVVYIPLVRNGELSRIHKMLWDRLSPLGTDVSLLYAPPMWMPHITIGFANVTHETIACVMEHVAFRSFDWEITIDSIAVGYQNPGAAAVIQSRHEFKR